METVHNKFTWRSTQGLYTFWVWRTGALTSCWMGTVLEGGGGSVRCNTHFPLWVSLHIRTILPWGMDAFFCATWPRKLLYAFPLLCLIPPLLERVRQEHLSIILVCSMFANRTLFEQFSSHLSWFNPESMTPIPIRAEILQLTRIMTTTTWSFILVLYVRGWHTAKYLSMEIQHKFKMEHMHSDVSKLSCTLQNKSSFQHELTENAMLKGTITTPTSRSATARDRIR